MTVKTMDSTHSVPILFSMHILTSNGTYCIDWLQYVDQFGLHFFSTYEHNTMWSIILQSYVQPI